MRDIKNIPIPFDNEPRLLSGDTLAAILKQLQKPTVQVQQRPLTHRRAPLDVIANSDIAPYTVFGITSKDNFQEPATIHVDYVSKTNAVSPLLLLTSGQTPIASGAHGNAWVVDYLDTTPLTVGTSAGGTQPKVGNMCGIQRSTGKVTGNAGVAFNCEFVCLTDISDDGKVLVMRTRYSSFMCKVAEDGPINSLDSGLVTVTDQSSNDYLEPESADATWPITVYNPTAVTFYPGANVMVQDVIHIGLCITPVDCNYFHYVILDADLTYTGTCSGNIWLQGAGDPLTDSGITIAELCCPLCPPLWHIKSGSLCAAFLNYVSGRWNVLVPSGCLEQDA